MKSLILGGVKSGKSRYAEQRARESAREVVYLATAIVADEEMRARVEAHRLQRPVDWQLVEEPFELAEAATRHAAEGRCLLIDCLTLWLSNLLTLRSASDADITTATDTLVSALDVLPGDIILVSNEVNMGVIPPNEIGRRFCDAAGRLHQMLGRQCDSVVLMVAGLPAVITNENVS